MIKEQQDVTLVDFNNTKKLCEALLQSPHYKKMGAEGVFAIVEKAKSVGVSPIDALNGGMYYVRGKVEMSASMMNQLIRMNRHSLTKDKKSNDSVCILHGRRADNGDTWVESFSIEDAKRAGLLTNPTWKTYPKDMLFARALSRLARQLFPDVIKGCYVQGEISAIPVEEVHVDTYADVTDVSAEEISELESLLSHNEILKSNALTFIEKRFGAPDFNLIDREVYSALIERARKEACVENTQLEA